MVMLPNRSVDCGVPGEINLFMSHACSTKAETLGIIYLFLWISDSTFLHWENKKHVYVRGIMVKYGHEVVHQRTILLGLQ